MIKNKLNIRGLKIIVCCFVITIFAKCKESDIDSSNNMAFDQVDYIVEFPKNFSIQEKMIPNIDIIGFRNFTIFDSLLISYKTNNNGLWSVNSLSTYQDFGSFIKRGEGPLEIMQGPSAATNNAFIKINNEVYAFIYDFEKGRVLRFNLSESIKTKEMQLSVMDNSLPKFLFNFAMIDTTSFFVKRMNENNTKQIRYIYSQENTSLPLNIEKLNDVSIKEGEDINILSTATKISNKHNRVVEMPIKLNYINLYSVDGDFSKTICLGEEMKDINKIQNEDEWDRLYTFADLRVYENFFGVVYINEDMKTYQTGRYKFPSILLFDWNGNPLAKINLNDHITSFDIDFINKELYTFDLHTDQLFKYDISKILNELQIEH